MPHFNGYALDPIDRPDMAYQVAAPTVIHVILHLFGILHSG
jgi:hypothetical protein